MDPTVIQTGTDQYQVTTYVQVTLASGGTAWAVQDIFLTTLEQYQAKLTTAEDNLASVQADVDQLTSVVSQINALVAAAAASTAASSTATT
jgi:hypothetical protein